MGSVFLKQNAMGIDRVPPVRSAVKAVVLKMPSVGQTPIAPRASAVRTDAASRKGNVVRIDPVMAGRFVMTASAKLRRSVM
jgi:hypothetical protein